MGQKVARLAEGRRVLNRLLFIGKTITDSKLRDQIRDASAHAHAAAVAKASGLTARKRSLLLGIRLILSRSSDTAVVVSSSGRTRAGSTKDRLLSSVLVSNSNPPRDLFFPASFA